MRFVTSLWQRLLGSPKKRARVSPDRFFARPQRTPAPQQLPDDDHGDFAFAHTDFSYSSATDAARASGDRGEASVAASTSQFPESESYADNPWGQLALRPVASPRDRFALSLTNGDQYALVYASRAASADAPHDQLRSLRKTCASANAKANLSSTLVLQDGMFCQWLQGEQRAVEACFSRIKRDPRHMAIMVLFSGPAPASMLDHWCMGMRSMYMAQGAAFKRAQRLRLSAKAAAYASPMGAWLKFNGALVHEALPDAVDQLPEFSDPASTNVLARLVCLIAVRSAAGASVLADAARSEHLRLAITRWAAAEDTDCDLQVAAASLLVDEKRTNVVAVSGRSLRVGIVREVVRSAAHWVLLLRDDDVGELDQLIDELRPNMPPHFVPARIAVVAPTWRGETKAQAQELLRSTGWQAEVLSIRHDVRGSWQALVPHLKQASTG